MEQAFNGIDGLDVMRSKSAPQLSYLELIFKRGTDTMHARQLVQERMAAVQNTLPTWAAPPVIMQPLSATSRVMKIGLSSKTTSLEDMSMTAYWKIRARLLAGAGRGERRHLGRAHQGVPGRGRARRSSSPTTCRSTR